MATELIPDYEVHAFLSEVAPGISNTKIAQMLGVHRNTVARYLDEGMPYSAARQLLALRAVDLAKEAKIHEAKAFEKLQESDRLSQMMDQYEL